jgi:hypothetical protein
MGAGSPLDLRLVLRDEIGCGRPRFDGRGPTYESSSFDGDEVSMVRQRQRIGSSIGWTGRSVVPVGFPHCSASPSTPTR